ncbi:MAG: DNA helicase RecQ [Bacteroidia bacterium]|nr:DNA helicase RecQ [Bacteroidia bacterium]
MQVMSPESALKQYFGYEEFRPLQREIIDSVLNQEDCLVIMPTGGGKSICYQIPAILMPGMTIVVSPLIALMKDQVEGLRANGVKAAFLNSSISSTDQASMLKEVELAEIDLLYVSPEKALTEDFGQLLRRVKIALFAIDEAHCISSWGHDFRPEYTQLNYFKRMFPHVPVIALTATADKITRRDIIKQLALPGPKVYLSSFDRPNLSLSVLPGRRRFEQISEFIRLRPDQSGIIYCTARKTTESLTKKLQDAGFPAAFYHAGMPADKRSKTQERFINDEVPIIVATIAFGMGIDKSNVRWIIHHNLPKNIEGYYQEIGRAGRDGLDSDTVLFYTYADVMQLHYFIDGSTQKELQLAKLERMQEYADAQICRRKILLSYFGEHLEENCGNCDVCKNPPTRFDGTVLAQKALSAIARVREMVGISMLIDILRGSGRKEIVEKGYDQVKTYGAGRDMSVSHWQEIIRQLLHQGFIEIAYDQKNVLKLTAASRDILFLGRKVMLVHPSEMLAISQKRQASMQKPKTKKEIWEEGLLVVLKDLRKQLADQESIAPYQVIADTGLEEMVFQHPTHPVDMAHINGMSKRKLDQYGESFMDTIIAYIRAQDYLPKGTSNIVSLSYYREGLGVEEIAQKRKMSPETVISHLGRLYEEGYEIEAARVLDQQLLDRIYMACEKLGPKASSKTYFSYLGGEISYAKIRFGISTFKKEINN